ncbi:MAG TPA: DUF5995 family protein [Solirubrobacteraceae bacterium]|nr:DUF5995 family protein [Solirubrobacteraceae bacterium]
MSDTPAAPGAATPADPILAVEAQMEAIVAPLAPEDGVARFNELYLAVTKAVAAETLANSYQDPEFISRLDVVFAALYFEAVAADAAGKEIPKAWAPLFEKRHTPGIAPLQFAIAGMNAHINHDLAVALVDVCDERKITLDEGTVQHHDYLAVNATLQRVEGEIKARFATGIVGDVDKVAGPLDDVVANWSVARARDNAWMTAQTIHALRDKPFLYKQFMLGLARNVGFAGRALLVRTQMR